MAKFVLEAAPTFKLKVDIPIPGQKPEKVELTFRHRTREELDTYLRALPGRDEVDILKDVLVGWELGDVFNDANLAKMNQNYPAAFRAIHDAYLEELAGIARKN